MVGRATKLVLFVEKIDDKKILGGNKKQLAHLWALLRRWEKKHRTAWLGLELGLMLGIG